GIRSRNRGGNDRYIDRNRNPRDITIDVPGNSRATDTGIDVRSGDQITFSATGIVVAGQRAGQVSPEGGRTSGLAINARPMPTAGVGALIGYIRTLNGQTSQPFFVGSQLTFTAPTDGRLYLAINDDRSEEHTSELQS